MESQPDLEIQLLETSRLTQQEQLVRKVITGPVEAFLAHLLIHQLALIPQQRLTSLLWPDPGDFQARTNLRHLLHHMRVAFPLIRCCCSQ